MTTESDSQPIDRGIDPGIDPAIDPGQVRWILDCAKKKNAAARELLKLDQDLALLASQEAMLKASLAWMLSHGQRPRSQLGDRSDIRNLSREISIRN